jgi:hypothetical protein
MTPEQKAWQLILNTARNAYTNREDHDDTEEDNPSPPSRSPNATNNSTPTTEP